MDSFIYKFIGVMTISEAKEVQVVKQFLFKTSGNIQFLLINRSSFVGSRLWSQCKDGQQQNTGGLFVNLATKLGVLKSKRHSYRPSL
jgi:hypothetical protein